MPWVRKPKRAAPSPRSKLTHTAGLPSRRPTATPSRRSTASVKGLSPPIPAGAGAVFRMRGRPPSITPIASFLPPSTRPKNLPFSRSRQSKSSQASSRPGRSSPGIATVASTRACGRSAGDSHRAIPSRPSIWIAAPSRPAPCGDHGEAPEPAVEGLAVVERQHRPDLGPALLRRRRRRGTPRRPRGRGSLAGRRARGRPACSRRAGRRESAASRARPRRPARRTSRSRPRSAWPPRRPRACPPRSRA